MRAVREPCAYTHALHAHTYLQVRKERSLIAGVGSVGGLYLNINECVALCA